MDSGQPDLSRLSLNQMSTNTRTLEETVEACSRQGFAGLGHGDTRLRNLRPRPVS